MMINKVIAPIVILLLLIIVILPSINTEPIERNHLHTVLGEFGTNTVVTYCKYAHKALIYLFFNRGDDYPFFYVTHVYDKNVHAYQRVKELGLTTAPTVFWDGGWRKDLGSPTNATAVANYKKSINLCKNRTVTDIDLFVDATWLGAVNEEPINAAINIPINPTLTWTNTEMIVNVSVTNNEASQYNGHIHVYVCDNQSSMGWYDLNARLYTMTFLDYAFNNNTAISAGSIWKDSANWDGMDHSNGTHLFDDVTESNTWVIASIFNQDNNKYSDETTGFRVGVGTDPKTFTVYFGNTTPLPLVIENTSKMSYTINYTLNWNTTYYWKVDVWNKKGEKTEGKIWSFTTRNNNPPHNPSNPIPYNGSTNVLPSCLEWTSEDPEGDVVTYDVYFGRSNPPPIIIKNISQNIYCSPLNWSFNTTYYWKIVAWDEYGASTEGPIWCFTTINNSLPYGPTEGFVEIDYTFCFDLPYNPEGNPYFVMWDWGDGHYSDWLGPYESGETVCANHTWTELGDYDIRIKIRDGWGNEYWSEPLKIHIYLGPVLKIEQIVGGFWKIGAEITNVGDYNATNVTWAIYYQKATSPILFGKGTISTLHPETTEYVYKIKPLFGLGWFNIKVDVEWKHTSADKTIKAFIFFIYIII